MRSAANRLKRIKSRRRFLLSLGSAVTAASGLYAWRFEPHWIDVTQHVLPVRNLPESLHGRTLIHVSDLHIGPTVDKAYLNSALQRINALQADYIVYTGDFVNHDCELSGTGRRIMDRLPRGRYGSFGVLGNHDFGENWKSAARAAQVTELAEQRGIQILRNEVVDAGGLQIAGLDDLWGGKPDLPGTLEKIVPDRAAIMLSHNPDTADLDGWSQFSGWILSGHTHGGQVRPPFLSPPVLPVRNKDYVSGTYTLSGNRTMYISRGIGYLKRVRFNARPEITVFTLRKSA